MSAGGVAQGGSAGASTAGTGGASVGAGGSAGGGAGAPSGGGSAGTSSGGVAGAAGSGGSAGDAPTSCLDEGAVPIGWASMNGGTIGGKGGESVTVSTIEELRSAASGDEARIISIQGELSGIVDIGSNKTLIGLPGAAITAGGLSLDGSQNVIVCNLKLQGTGVTEGDKTGSDTVHIVNGASNLWFDHCDVSDGDDGNFDITHASDYITVSWTKFHYTSSSRVHRFSNLIAASDTDTGEYRITFHHDWWADNVDQRMPRDRYGDIHVFNNYYSATGNSYCVNSGYEAKLLVENNYFDHVNAPLSPSDNGQLQAIGNVFDGTTGNDMGTEGGFTPPYTYELDPAEDIPDLVTSGAGPQ